MKRQRVRFIIKTMMEKLGWGGVQQGGEGTNCYIHFSRGSFNVLGYRMNEQRLVNSQVLLRTASD